MVCDVSSFCEVGLLMNIDQASVDCERYINTLLPPYLPEDIYALIYGHLIGSSIGSNTLCNGKIKFSNQ